MCRNPQQGLALTQGFIDETDLRVFEVPEPAVYQPARPAGRRVAHIALIEQTGPDATGCSVPCDAGAVDTAADDDQIE